MDPLVRYYLRQAGRGNTNGTGPIYEAQSVLQRGYGIGSFFTGLWRTVRAILWSGAKTLGREMLRTGGDTLSDMARSTGESPRDIVSRHVNETAVKRKKNNGTKKKITKRDIFS